MGERILWGEGRGLYEEKILIGRGGKIKMRKGGEDKKGKGNWGC